MSLADRFWRKVDKTGECWLWCATRDGCGYGLIRRDGFMRKAHRVAYELEHGSIPHGMHVLHRCDNPRCVRPSHLSLGTHADNMRDMARKRRAASPAGSLNGRARLTAADIERIRERLAVGEQCTAIARSYGVARQTISHIRCGRNWREERNREVCSGR